MSDDRKEFEDSKRIFAAKLAQDNALQQKNWDLYTLADRHSYPYLWNWMGVPVIQNPVDIVTMQEIIWMTKPDVIIETGVARGGSVVMYAAICALLGKGQVIGIDIDIRAHNRSSIENSPVCERIALIEGSSTDPLTFDQVQKNIVGNDIMVVLDSNHTHQHVLDELRLYAPLVTKGHYLVVADTSIEYLPSADVRGSRPWSRGNNPKTAMDVYRRECDRFELDPFFNNRLLLSSSPNGYFKCIA